MGLSIYCFFQKNLYLILKIAKKGKGITLCWLVYFATIGKCICLSKKNFAKRKKLNKKYITVADIIIMLAYCTFFKKKLKK